MSSPMWMLTAQQSTQSLYDVNVNRDTSNAQYNGIFRQQPIHRNIPRSPKSGSNITYPQGYNQTSRMDSTGEYFYAGQSIDSLELGYEYKVDIDQYLSMRKKKIVNGMWDSLLSRYSLKEALTGGDLARLISQSTGVTIPVPPNPVIGLFGKPQISINAQGDVHLTIGWRWDSQNLGTVSTYGQTQSTPIFQQDIRVNLSAKIGDKLKFGTDWNTQRQFDFDNTFKIGYEGEDDEIIKKIEVGNVSLPVPSTLIGGGSELFGVRADFQFGPLYLKTIFSQRRGKRKSVNVKGGVSKTPFTIRAYDYEKNHFFLDTAYMSYYDSFFQTSTGIIPKESKHLRINRITVWESSNDPRDGPQASNSIAIADLPPRDRNTPYSDAVKNMPIESGKVERAIFMQLDSMRYEVDYNLGTVTIQNLRPDRYYAVSYKVEGPTLDESDDIYYGTFPDEVATNETNVLKLIYVPNLQPTFSTLWKRQMKNIYSINSSQIDVANTKVGIWYINQSNDSADVLQGAPDKLVTIFGVDKVNNSSGSNPPDGIFDLRMPFFNAKRGEIIFPSIEPFRQGLRNYFEKQGTPQLAEQYIFPDVYDKTQDIARRNTARDRFVITGEVSGRASDRIFLGAFNLAPNSVKVTLDGVPLREYEDFIVDEYSGQLTIKNQRALLPNANLKIEYESREIFNIATKTLMGLRAEYQLYKSRQMQTDLGFTIMHYDQSAIIDRVRLGEEPVSNTMIGLDAKLKWDTPWLTKALDYLPFYDTKAKSSISLQGEWAMTLPEPNKKKSDVTSDNGMPVVYIDDFDGSQRHISLGISPAQWSHSSSPVDEAIATTDSLRTTYKGRMFWFQYFIPRVPLNEIYPGKETAHGYAMLSPMHINFDPDYRGIYNNNTDFQDSLNLKVNPDADLSFSDRNGPNREKIWGGMMRLFSTFNTNFDAENIDYIEVMMRVDARDAGKTKMFIDLGQISEDVIPNQYISTEDGITDNNPYPNNIIDQGEDIGIDALSNNSEKEAIYYGAPLNLEKDPARDDYYFNFYKDDRDRVEKDFVRYNNYEGNAKLSEMGQFPDTEVLNRNNGQTIVQANDYFSYEVDVTPDPNINPMIVGGANNWYLYRIPIRKPNKRIGNPSFSNIQYIRVWFKGGLFKARIAEWRLVGSQWQRVNQFQANVDEQDSVLSISFVNREENQGAPDYYTMPPGVRAPHRIGTSRNEDLKLNEQSIAVGVKNLRWGQERMAVRLFHPQDIFYYKRLKFFVHGDGSMPGGLTPGAVPKAYSFIRFGTDSSNYYEYRRPLLRNWQDIDIELAQLTAIKQIRDESGITERQVFPVPGDPLAIFAVKGNPVLTRVQFFGLGIANPDGRYPNELTTTMWVDELRLVDPEASSDWAGIASANITMADLLTINANVQHTKPNFHKLEDRFGDRVNHTNWSVNMVGNIDKFAPKSFKNMKIPIAYTHAERMQDPEFVANNDINLKGAAEAAKLKALNEGKTLKEAEQIAHETIKKSQTLNIQDSWSMTGVSLGIPVKHWLVSQTINRVTLGYSYAQEYERSPVVEQKFNWIWKLDAQYSVNLPDLLSFEYMKWAKGMPLLGAYSQAKISLLPSNLTASLNFSRRRLTEKSRFLKFPSPVIRDFSAQRQAGFTWKLGQKSFLSPTINYKLSMNSTLVPLELDENGMQRTGSEIAKLMFFKDGNVIDFGRTNMLNQNFTIKFKPILPLGIYAQYLETTGSFGTDYNWNNPLQEDPTIHDVAKTSSFNNTIRFDIGLRLKSLSEHLLDGKIGPKRGRAKDSTSSNIAGVMGSIGSILRTIFLDYDKLDIAFKQSNNASNQGLFGGTGLTNFWSARGSENIYGPSMAYQLGLVSSPHGGFNMTSSDKFPFFGFETYPGLRPPNAILPENFAQKTTLDVKTTRPLWEDATLDLNWSTNFAYNKNQIVETDEFGNPTFTNVIGTESFDRTYLSLPSVFGINIFDNTIDHVIELYEAEKEQILASDRDTVSKNKALSQALTTSFHDGLQAFSFFGGKFLPAVNWAIHWKGIEKWDFWKDYVKTAALEHAYVSKYTENNQLTGKGKITQGQQIQIGFQPLIGLDVTFDNKVFDGSFTASLKYGTTTGFQVTSANRSTISRNSNDKLTANASYVLDNWEFPLFGLVLENEMEFSFMASYEMTERTTYDITEKEKNGDEGRKLDGNTKITIEPRVRYSLSNRVTASFFYRYESTTNEGAASPGFSTHQIGFDFRLSIAGGR